MFDVDYLDLPPLAGAGGEVLLPGSKSISNRVLLLSAFSNGKTLIRDLLASDDTAVMLDALVNLGCELERSSAGLTVKGVDGSSLNRKARLFLGNAGTAMRPLAAVLAVLGGEFELSGVPRMHERPIADLINALRQLGCDIECTGAEGFPPLRIGRPTLQLTAPISVRGDVSSQFLTALLMALPLVSRQDIRINVIGKLISQPYIAITLNLMSRFGVHVQQEGNWQSFMIPAGSIYKSPRQIYVEGDASSASYFIALGAITTSAGPRTGVKINGIGADSIQGDIRFIEAARMMGAQVEASANSITISRGPGPCGHPLKAVDLDCNHIPDAAMTLAVMALYAEGTTVLRNIASWRVKETDRLSAMATELRKLGASVEEGADFLSITAPATWRTAAINTYDDHRMAMCFSLAAFNPASLPIRIMDPKCVAKTYPDYFETLFSVSDAEPHRIPVICIDGPTASGKGTLAAKVAEKLGYRYLDSGALYRTTAFAAQQAGIALDNVQELTAIAKSLPVRFKGGRIHLNGHDVTESIRSEASGMAASVISAHFAVRDALVSLQRGFRGLPGLVADGRDMGNVIFPDAGLKVFLTASAPHRADRRHKQLMVRGDNGTLEGILLDLEARDARDTSRQAAPLRPAEDAKMLDNSDLSIEESVDQVLDWWQGTRPF